MDSQATNTDMMEPGEPHEGQGEQINTQEPVQRERRTTRKRSERDPWLLAAAAAEADRLPTSTPPVPISPSVPPTTTETTPPPPHIPAPPPLQLSIIANRVGGQPIYKDGIPIIFMRLDRRNFISFTAPIAIQTTVEAARPRLSIHDVNVSDRVWLLTPTIYRNRFGVPEEVARTVIQSQRLMHTDSTLLTVVVNEQTMHVWARNRRKYAADRRHPSNLPSTHDFIPINAAALGSHNVHELHPTLITPGTALVVNTGLPPGSIPTLPPGTYPPFQHPHLPSSSHKSTKRTSTDTSPKHPKKKRKKASAAAAAVAAAAQAALGIPPFMMAGMGPNMSFQQMQQQFEQWKQFQAFQAMQNGGTSASSSTSTTTSTTSSTSADTTTSIPSTTSTSDMSTSSTTSTTPGDTIATSTSSTASSTTSTSPSTSTSTSTSPSTSTTSTPTLPLIPGLPPLPAFPPSTDPAIIYQHAYAQAAAAIQAQMLAAAADEEKYGSESEETGDENEEEEEDEDENKMQTSVKPPLYMQQTPTSGIITGTPYPPITPGLPITPQQSQSSQQPFIQSDPKLNTGSVIAAANRPKQPKTSPPIDAPPTPVVEQGQTHFLTYAFRFQRVQGKIGCAVKDILMPLGVTQQNSARQVNGFNDDEVFTTPTNYQASTSRRLKLVTGRGLRRLLWKCRKRFAKAPALKAFVMNEIGPILNGTKEIPWIVQTPFIPSALQVASSYVGAGQGAGAMANVTHLIAQGVIPPPPRALLNPPQLQSMSTTSTPGQSQGQTPGQTEGQGQPMSTTSTPGQSQDPTQTPGQTQTQGQLQGQLQGQSQGSAQLPILGQVPVPVPGQVGSHQGPGQLPVLGPLQGQPALSGQQMPMPGQGQLPGQGQGQGYSPSLSEAAIAAAAAAVAAAASASASSSSQSNGVIPHHTTLDPTLMPMTLDPHSHSHPHG